MVDGKTVIGTGNKNDTGSVFIV